MMEKKEKIIYAICYGILSLAFAFTSIFIFRTLFKEPGFIIIIKLLYAIVFLLCSYMIATSVIKIFNKESGKMIYEKLYDKFIFSFMLLILVSSIYMLYDLLKKWNEIGFPGAIATIFLVLMMLVFSIVELIKLFKKIKYTRYL